MKLCFPDWEKTDEKKKNRIILHEFGHALGFHHEQKNINLDIQYNRPDVLAYYKDAYGWDTGKTETNVLGALDSSKWNFTEFDPYSIMLYPIRQYRTLKVKNKQSGELEEKKYKLTHNPINFTYNTNLSQLDIAAIKRMYPGRDTPSKRTKSGNGIKYVKYEYSVVGDEEWFGTWRNWSRKFTLPRGTILAIRNVTTRARRGYVKDWMRFDLNKIAVGGRIEDGKYIYGEVDGYLEVVYLPE